MANNETVEGLMTFLKEELEIKENPFTAINQEILKFTNPYIS